MTTGQGGTERAADVVCFGMIAPATLLIVEDLPPWNTGATVSRVDEFISDDAAIVAMLLRRWEVRSALIGTTLGDDPQGRQASQRLRDMGIVGEFSTSPDVRTPYELNISDRSGGRTYFWKRDPEVLATLDTADLSSMRGAMALYADWYDGDHVLRPLGEARRLGVRVFFNIEHGHEDPQFVARYAPYVDHAQAITDAAQEGSEWREVAARLLRAGVGTVLVTMASQSCAVADSSGWVHVRAPELDVVDACGAGAALSAGYLYGLLKGWSMDVCLRFAVAASSLSCTDVGPKAFPIHEVRSLAASLSVETGSSLT